MFKSPKLDALEVTCALKDSYGAFIYWNEALSRNFELPADGMLGKTEYHFMSDEDAAAIRANDKSVLNTGKKLTAVEYVHMASGERTSWLVNKFRIVSNGKRYLAVVALNVQMGLNDENEAAALEAAQAKITKDMNTCVELMTEIVEKRR